MISVEIAAQLDAVLDQAAQRRRVLVVVLGHHRHVGLVRGGLEGFLVLRRQLVPRLLVDEEVDRRARLPPARVVVVLGDLVEAELLVVVGADPFRGVDRALFQRRVDVASRGSAAVTMPSADQHRAAEAGDAHLDALAVGDGLDLLAEPAAHLHAGVAAEEGDDVVVAVELVEQLLAAAVVDPGVHLPGVQAERAPRCRSAKVLSLPT